LERNYRRFTYKDFQMMYPLIDREAWWDSVDALRKPMSLWVKEQRQYLDEVMHRLLAADSFWQRRVAITLQLLWKEQTDTAWLERAILQNRHDEEFFIQKAIGWALRDYSKTNPDWVRSFLQRHELSRLAVREASKYV
jgi:3-methyladenine DNA glycosylase AlkD